MVSKATQKNDQNGTNFALSFKQKATNSETTILQKYLQQWCKLNKFETRMFRLIRNAFKYGDQLFVRDPETKKLYHVDAANLTKIIDFDARLFYKNLTIFKKHQLVGGNVSCLGYC